MFRKSIFWGLMVLLGAVLVSLILRGRRQETKQAPRVVEIVKQYKLTPTRVLAPDDLEIILGPGEKATAQSRTSVTPPPGFMIRNKGTIAYSNPEVEFVYLGKNDNVLETHTRKIETTIPSGQDVSVEHVANDEVPEGTTRIVIRVRSAEFASPPASSDAARK